MTSGNVEQDEALAALKFADNLTALERIATRQRVESETSLNIAAAAFALSRAKVRVTLLRCVVFGCVLAAGWSAFLFTTLH